MRLNTAKRISLIALALTFSTTFLGCGNSEPTVENAHSKTVAEEPLITVDDSLTTYKSYSLKGINFEVPDTWQNDMDFYSGERDSIKFFSNDNVFTVSFSNMDKDITDAEFQQYYTKYQFSEHNIDNADYIIADRHACRFSGKISEEDDSLERILILIQDGNDCYHIDLLTPSLSEMQEVFDRIVSTISFSTSPSSIEQSNEDENKSEVADTPNTETNLETTDSEVLLSVVRDALDGELGLGVEITKIDFNAGNLVISVSVPDLKPDYSDTVKFGIEKSTIDTITFPILDLEEIYFNSWNTITIDFGNEGKAVLTKAMIVDESLGKYFKYPDNIVE